MKDLSFLSAADVDWLLETRKNAKHERVVAMKQEITAEQASQITMAADDAYEKIKWMVISSYTLRDELRRLALDSFIAGLRQGEMCKGDK